MTVSPQAIEVLKQQDAKANDTYIFPSPNGGPISPGSVNNMLKQVLERASRRSGSTTSATPSQPSPCETVSSMLGHFSAGFTLDTYAHVTTSAQEESAQTIGNVLIM